MKVKFGMAIDHGSWAWKGTYHPAKIMRKPEVLQANEDRGVLPNRFAKC